MTPFVRWSRISIGGSFIPNYLWSQF
jgi:hypothetical protein